MSDQEKKLSVKSGEVAVPEVSVEGNETEDAEAAASAKRQEDLENWVEVPDDELETAVDYSGAFPEIRIMKKKKD